MAGNELTKVLDQIRGAVAPDREPARAVREVTNAVLGFQVRQLKRWLGRTFGPVVASGPFAGMKVTPLLTARLITPYLVGCYEAELWHVVERVIQTPYRHIVNVGISEGYYAVGLALKKPDVQIYAYDIDPKTLIYRQEWTRANGVAERVVLGEECRPTDLRRLSGPGSLVICDIEGAEEQLLDPGSIPELTQTDILVECHDSAEKPISTRLTERFRATHEIEFIPNRAIDPNSLPFLRPLIPVQKFIAIWEGRPVPTPWLWMTAQDQRG